MASWDVFESYRLEAEKLKAEREAAAEHPKPEWPIGSKEWFEQHRSK